MIELLLFVIVVLLTVITAKVAQIAAAQKRAHVVRAAALAARPYELGDAVGSEDKPRSVFDQIATELAQLNHRARRVQGILAYLRSYTWEQKDPRLLEELRNPPESAFWKRKFASRDDPAEYDLWMRERDMDEAWHKDVVRPARDPDKQK